MKTSGIYCIRNIQTGSEYIGSSVDVHKRWNTHKWNLEKRHNLNPHLQNAWNKYGENAFIFEVIEETTNLNNREMYWINERKPKMNCTNVILRNDPDEFGFTRSEETRKKISEAQLGISRRPLTDAEKKKLSESLKGKSGYWKGKKFSDETKKKLSLVHAGKPHTEEHKQNLSEARKRFLNSPEGKEHCKHLSELYRGKPGSSTGHHFSEEYKKNMSEIQKALWLKRCQALETIGDNNA
jgi:group I intron endonuclease